VRWYLRYALSECAVACSFELRGIFQDPAIAGGVVDRDHALLHHLFGLEVIDVQASGNAAQAYVALRHAAGHMTMIANPLADAIAKQFPAKYTI
jgi:hypothetical protein